MTSWQLLAGADPGERNREVTRAPSPRGGEASLLRAGGVPTILIIISFPFLVFPERRRRSLRAPRSPRGEGGREEGSLSNRGRTRGGARRDGGGEEKGKRKGAPASQPARAGGRPRREGRGNDPQAASVPSGPALPPRPAVAAVSPPPRSSKAPGAPSEFLFLFSPFAQVRGDPIAGEGSPSRRRRPAFPSFSLPCLLLLFLLLLLRPAQARGSSRREEDGRRRGGKKGRPAAPPPLPKPRAVLLVARPQRLKASTPPGGRAKGGREAPLGSDAGPRPGRRGRGDAERGALIGAAREEPRKEGRKEGRRGAAGKRLFSREGGKGKEAGKRIQLRMMRRNQGVDIGKIQQQKWYPSTG
ncbi:uncharacterized protein LOC110077292 [Pogona vitticeps]